MQEERSARYRRAAADDLGDRGQVQGGVRTTTQEVRDGHSRVRDTGRDAEPCQRRARQKRQGSHHAHQGTPRQRVGLVIGDSFNPSGVVEDWRF